MMWFKSISVTAKALTALAVAVGVGVTCSGIWNIPTQVQTNTGAIAESAADIAEIQRTHVTLVRRLDRMICLQLLPDDGNPLSCP